MKDHWRGSKLANRKPNEGPLDQPRVDEVWLRNLSEVRYWTATSRAANFTNCAFLNRHLSVNYRVGIIVVKLTVVVNRVKEIAVEPAFSGEKQVRRPDGLVMKNDVLFGVYRVTSCGLCGRDGRSAVR